MTASKTQTQGEPHEEWSECSLSDAWVAWVSENALEGASEGQLVSELTQEGLPEVLARREVRQVLSSASFLLAQRWRREALRLRHACELQAKLRWENRPPQVERRAGLTPEALRRDYLSASQPVILTDVASDWPALERWTDEQLKARVGHVVITCCQGSEGKPRGEQSVASCKVELPFGALIDEVARLGVSDELYVVGNHNVLSVEGMEVLLDDLSPRVSSFLEGGLTPQKTSLWFGPAGTLTRLHYDPLTVLYAQVRGVKRFRLASPLTLSLLLRAQEGNTTELDWESLPHDLTGRVYELELHPGEVLLIPTGWWHEVYALTPSISLGMLNVRGRHRHPWYRPKNIT